MIEFIILMTVGVFGILPMIGSSLLGPFSGSGYKEDLRAGYIVVGIILAVVLSIFLVSASTIHFMYDGPTIIEILNNISNKQ